MINQSILLKRGLTSIVHKFCDKKASGGTIKNENISNKKFAEDLQKLRIILSFLDNMWRADLANMQSTSKLEKGLYLFLCVQRTL